MTTPQTRIQQLINSLGQQPGGSSLVSTPTVTPPAPIPTPTPTSTPAPTITVPTLTSISSTPTTTTTTWSTPHGPTWYSGPLLGDFTITTPMPLPAPVPTPAPISTSISSSSTSSSTPPAPIGTNVFPEPTFPDPFRNASLSFSSFSRDRRRKAIVKGVGGVVHLSTYEDERLQTRVQYSHSQLAMNDARRFCAYLPLEGPGTGMGLSSTSTSTSTTTSSSTATPQVRAAQIRAQLSRR